MFVASSSKPPSSSSLTVRHGFIFFHRGQPFSHYKLTALQTCCSCCLSPVPRSLLQTPSPQHDNFAMTSRRPHDNLTATSHHPHHNFTANSLGPRYLRCRQGCLQQRFCRACMTSGGRGSRWSRSGFILYMNSSTR